LTGRLYYRSQKSASFILKPGDGWKHPSPFFIIKVLHAGLHRRASGCQETGCAAGIPIVNKTIQFFNLAAQILHYNKLREKIQW
jgi:hypothetical protein